MKTLKKIFSLLLLLSFTVISAQTDANDIVGKWKGIDGMDVGFMTITKSGYASFEYNGQVMGGRSFDLNGTKAKMTYEIVDKKDELYYLDFETIYISNGQFAQTRYCIYKFIDADTMKFAIGFDGERPYDFKDDNSIIFKRY